MQDRAFQPSGRKAFLPTSYLPCFLGAWLRALLKAWPGLLLALSGLFLSACSDAEAPISAEAQQQPLALRPEALRPGLLQEAAARVAQQAGAGRNAVWMLADGYVALAARLLLVQQAQRSLDLQYYIWHDDIAGALLFDALRQAADRGVQVRLLLDDNNTAGMDELLAALDAHPRIEVRLFNANEHRRWRWLGYITDFTRMNRRMHNKSLTADGLASIVGGRNVGDAYFGLGDQTLFADLDVLALGPVAGDVSADFERYWRSAPVRPAGSLLAAAQPGVLEVLAVRAQALSRTPQARRYIEALSAQGSAGSLLNGRPPDAWSTLQLVSDDPAKGLGPVPAASLLTHELAQGQQPPKRSLYLISPYFVPGEKGMQWFAELRRQGVQVLVLTNALAATDVAVVHSGYAKYRHELLAMGVQLWELKPDASAPSTVSAFGAEGSSSASLHAKTFLADCDRLFVGSFNLDPRSASLNTEMGVTLAAPDLAQTVCAHLQAQLPLHAYQLKLAADGQMEWWEEQAQARKVWTEEPHSSAWQRAMLRLLAWLPVEWLL